MKITIILVLVLIACSLVLGNDHFGRNRKNRFLKYKFFAMKQRFAERHRNRSDSSFSRRFQNSRHCLSECSEECQPLTSCIEACPQRCANYRNPRLCQRNCKVNECRQEQEQGSCGECRMSCKRRRDQCKESHCSKECLAGSTRWRKFHKKRQCRRCMSTHCQEENSETTTPAEELLVSDGPHQQLLQKLIGLGADVE